LSSGLPSDGDGTSKLLLGHFPPTVGLDVKFFPLEEEFDGIDGVLATEPCSGISVVALGYFPPTVDRDVEFLPPKVKLGKFDGVLATELCGVSASGLFCKDANVSYSC